MAAKGKITDLDLFTRDAKTLADERLIFSSLRGKTYVRRYVKPQDPKTEKQLKRRKLFREAVARWHRLEKEDKDHYDNRAKGRKMSGFNLFISEYLAEN